MFGESFGEVERRGAADVVLQQVGEFALKGGVLAGLVVIDRQLVEGSDQRLGHVAAAVGAAGRRAVVTITAALRTTSLLLPALLA